MRSETVPMGEEEVQRRVTDLVARSLLVQPLATERMTLTHSGNRIYDVTLPDAALPERSERHVMVRLRGTEKDSFAKTADNIDALAQLGLPVPHVLSIGTLQTDAPWHFMILAKIPGRDLLYELPRMTPAQVTRLAEQVVTVQTLVQTALPQGTAFGWGHIGGGGAQSRWEDVFAPECLPAALAAPMPPVVEAIGRRLQQQRIRLRPYFDAVAPLCFLEDLTTKNVLLQHGELQGLIDFDSVCFGDPFWMIGLVAGCIVSDIGEMGDIASGQLFYVEELCRCWGVTEEQRQRVTYYSAQRAMDFLRNMVVVPSSDRAARIIAAADRWLTELEQA